MTTYSSATPDLYPCMFHEKISLCLVLLCAFFKNKTASGTLQQNQQPHYIISTAYRNFNNKTTLSSPRLLYFKICAPNRQGSRPQQLKKSVVVVGEMWRSASSSSSDQTAERNTNMVKRGWIVDTEEKKGQTN